MARARRFGHATLTLWLTGLRGASKSTLAYALEKRLYEAGQHCAVPDGDNLRHHLNHGQKARPKLEPSNFRDDVPRKHRANYLADLRARLTASTAQAPGHADGP